MRRATTRSCCGRTSTDCLRACVERSARDEALLLDTNAFPYWTAGAKKLSPRARKLIADPQSVLYLSAVSSWEIVIKHALGKLELPEAPEKFVPSRMARHAISGLPFEHSDALAIAGLPQVHDDPFDRALIAQAIQQKLAVITSDLASKSTVSPSSGERRGGRGRVARRRSASRGMCPGMSKRSARPADVRVVAKSSMLTTQATRSLVWTSDPDDVMRYGVGADFIRKV